jgi:glycosidase
MKTDSGWIVSSAHDEKTNSAQRSDRQEDIPYVMGKAILGSGALRVGHASRMEFAIHLTLFALLLSLCAFAGEPHLGWIPVQQIKPGGEFTLDMHRFYQAGDTAQIQATGTTGNYTAGFDPANFQFHLQLKPDASGLVDVPFEIPGSPLKGVLTLAVAKRPSQLFSYSPGKPVGKVSVAGSFNGWSKDKNAMGGPDANGVYSASVEVGPGTYQYKFLVDGEWILDPANPEKISDNFGGFNSVVKVGSTGGGAPFIFADKLAGGELAVALITNGSPVNRVSAVAELPDGTSSALAAKIENNRVTVPAAGLPTGAWIRVIAADETGNTSNVIRVPLDPGAGFRWQDAVMYYAFTDRFFDGDKSNDKPINDPNVKWPANYHGGDWRGIRQKIEEGYFDALGVNTIWLAPLNKNPDKAWQESPEPHRWYTGYHGYWPVSPTEPDPHFGDAKELKALVAAAHKHGIKIIADMVLHHVHTDHPWWKERRDWFGTLELPDGRKNLRLWDEQQFTTWFEPFLPAFNFGNPAAVKALIDNSAWWAKEYGLDGFRLDAVKHVVPDFWWKFREGLREQVEKQTGHPLYLVGETFKDRGGIMSFVGPNMLDGQFDFPLYDTVRDAFGTGWTDMKTLDESLTASELVYGKETLMSPLIGNHDKGRFMAYADGELPDYREAKEEEIGWKYPPNVSHPGSYDKIKVAQAFLMSIDGVPMIYYGDEIGMTGAGDPDNRRDMRFGKEVTAAEKEVLENFEKLGRFRHDHPALRYGSRRTLAAGKDVYAFVRAQLDDRVLCVFNRGDKTESLALKLEPEMADGDYADALGGRKWSVKDGEITLSVPPRSAMLMTRSAP